jgi:putative flippase GtrA
MTKFCFRALVSQILRFCLVGLAAALLQMSVVILLVQTQLMLPLIANVCGFALAFQISYWGHRFWTFKVTDSLYGQSFLKLLLVQLLALITNELLFYLFLSQGLPYPLALGIVLALMPVFTFIASKCWVFPKRKNARLIAQ